jgi:tetratricopeptide (TPR) repeat protein
MTRLCPWFLLLLGPLYSSVLPAQVQTLGSISGQLRVAGGDTPSRQIMLELRLHGAAINSIYADAQGRFGFNNLEANPYHIVINDEAYYPVDELVDLNPAAPNRIVQISLRLRDATKKDDPVGARASGGNPYLVDLADYNKRFPKKALREYARGVDAERKGNNDDAIAHYIDALKIAPDYYPAHNNLGSLYLGKADFKSAERQFEETVRLDQTDAQAYFNLGNVFLLKGRYSESEAEIASGLQRRPDSAFGHFLEGCLDARTGKLPEAEKSLRTALQLDSTMWQAHLQLVSLYLQEQRRQDAIAELQEFLKAFPSAPTAPKARDLLQKLQSENGSAHTSE